jgi:hypothetical protein
MGLALAALTLAMFANPWWGHDRGIDVTRDGHAVERVLDSCCHRVIDLRLKLSNPRGTARDARVTARVEWVRVYDRRDFTSMHLPVPRVGDTATLRLRNGVLVEPLTGTTYCRPNRNACGA